MLAAMESNYEAELTEFLFQYVSQKEYFVAWLPETLADISALDKSDFVLCIEEGRIVGCMGTYLSREQKTARLLGPVVRKEFFDQYADSLYAHCLRKLPEEIDECRIAFLKDNQNCRKWCEKNRFERYNAETTMILNRARFAEQPKPQSVAIRLFEQRDREDLAQIHPDGTFFTLDELIRSVSAQNRLLLAFAQSAGVGYVYYEQSADGKKGEVSLLHVRADCRKQGYGTMLLNSAIKDLLQKGVEEISISVRVGNTAAHRLYERIGFADGDTVYAYKKAISKQTGF